MGSAKVTDPYQDPVTGLLRNKVGARTREALAEAEGDLSFARLVQLSDNEPDATGDLRELCEIHFYLFQDVYDWAGQIRRVDLRKNVEGAVFFLRYSMIENAARFAAAELASENNLRNLSRHDFVERLSYYYDQLNYIHPFREGNGRAQRVFWNRIAHDAGWVLDWREVHGEVNDRACQIGAEHEDLGPLKEMFDAMVQPLSASSEHSLAAEPSSRARLSFPLKSEETAD